MKKVRVLSMLLAALLLVIGVACGKNNTAPTTAGDTSAATTATGDAKPITITFAEHVANVEQQSPYVWQTAQAYMKLHPNVTIKFDGNESSVHNNKMRMAAQAGQLPEMLYLDWNMQQDFIAQGNLLYDMKKEVAESGIEKNFLPGMLRKGDDGAIYGLPNEPMLPCVYYNKDIFDQAGVKYPEDWTWEQFLDACNTFKSKGITPIAMGSMNAFAVWMQQVMLVRYGFYERFENIKAGKDSWVNDDFIRCFEKIRDFGKAGIMPANVTTMDYFQSCEMFYGGKSAMLNAGSWEAGKINAAGIADKVGVWFGPTFSDGVGNQKVTVKSATGPFCISLAGSKDAEKLKVMMDFLVYMYSPEGTRVTVEVASCVPTTKYDGDVSKASPIIVTLVNALNNDWAPAKIPDSVLPSSVTQTFFDAIWGTLLGNYTPKDALQKIQSDFEAVK